MACRYWIRGMQEDEDQFSQLGSDFPHHLFNIEIKIYWISSLYQGTTIETFNRSIVDRRDVVLSEENGGNIVHSLVEDLSAYPELIDAVVPNILSVAREVGSLPRNLGRQVIRLRFEMLVEVSLDDAIREVIDESMASSVNFNPASESSIKTLKRVKWNDEDEDHLPLKKRRKLVEGSSSTKDCTVCLDEFLDGDDVASMPCGHVYHYGCIVKWLETSHMCPLCRYQMPID